MLNSRIGKTQKRTERKAFILHEERSDTWPTTFQICGADGGRVQTPASLCPTVGSAEG